MSDKNHLREGLLAGLVLLLAGDVLLVWPTMRAARAAREEIASVEPILADLPIQKQIVASLGLELQQKRRSLERFDGPRPIETKAETILASIRRAAESAGVPSDDVRVRIAQDSGADAPLSERDAAVTVHVTSTFDSIFALTRRLELMNEPLCVTRVRIAGSGAVQLINAPILDAAIDLELTGIGRLDMENE